MNYFVLVLMKRQKFRHTFESAQKLTRKQCEQLVGEVWNQDDKRRFVLNDHLWAVIQRSFQRKSSIVIWPTGVGKSLAYFVPAVILEAKILILSPLLSLRTNQFQNYGSKLLSAGKKVCMLSEKNFEEALKADVIFATPESISRVRQVSQHISEGLEALWSRIDIFIADEAHSIVTWGEDFRIEYHHAMQALGRFPNDKIYMALTATADEFITSRLLQYFSQHQEIVVRYLDTVAINPIIRIEMQSRSDLFMWVISIINQRFKNLSKCVVFTNTVRLCNELFDFISSVKKDCKVEKFTGQLNDNEKLAAIAAIENHSRTGQQKLIVIGTSALGTGVDFDFEFSIHAGLPYSAIELIQQIGRIGRRQSFANDHVSYILWSDDMISELKMNHEKSKATQELAKKILNILKPIKLRYTYSPYLTEQEAEKLFPNSMNTILELYRKEVLRKDKQLFRTQTNIQDYFVFKSTRTGFQNDELVKLQEFKTKWLDKVEDFCKKNDGCLSEWLFRQIGYSDIHECGHCSTEQSEKYEIPMENRESNRLLADNWKRRSISEISSIPQFTGINGKLYKFNRLAVDKTFPVNEIIRFIQDFHNSSISKSASGLHIVIVKNSMTKSEVTQFRTTQVNYRSNIKDPKIIPTWQYVDKFSVSSIPESSDNPENILVLYGRSRSRQHIAKDLRIISKHFNTQTLANVSIDVSILFIRPQRPRTNPNYKPPEKALVKLFQENSPADIAKVLYYALNYADITRYQNRILEFLLNFTQHYRFFLLNFDERLLSQQELAINFKGQTITPAELHREGFIAFSLTTQGSGMNREAKTMILKNLAALHIIDRIRGKRELKKHSESHSGFYRLNPSLVMELLKKYPETHKIIFGRIIKNPMLKELIKKQIKPPRFRKIENDENLIRLSEIRILYDFWNENAHLHSIDDTAK